MSIYMYTYRHIISSVKRFGYKRKEDASAAKNGPCRTVNVIHICGEHSMAKASMKGSFLLVVAQATLTVTVHSQRCAFTGHCFFDRSVDKSIPCAVDQPPSETLPTGLWDEFLDFCDDLAPSIKDHQLCCDAGQFQTLKKEMRSAEVIGIKRCPGCYRAFKNLMCQMTCSPKQADFIVVNATRNDDRGTGPALQEIVYGLDKEFADALFNTCNKARSNLYVKLTTLMCGQYTNRCSATKFLSFLGSTDTEGGYSPFRIRHLLLSDANRTLKVKSYLGSEITLHRQQWKLHNTCKIEGST